MIIWDMTAAFLVMLPTIPGTCLSDSSIQFYQIVSIIREERVDGLYDSPRKSHSPDDVHVVLDDVTDLRKGMAYLPEAANNPGAHIMHQRCRYLYIDV